MPTTAAEDTEITLGTGKMLLLFFGLVALCAVFFAMGFTMGKNTARPAPVTDNNITATTGGSRPSGAKNPASPAPTDLTFYKSVEQKDANTQLTPPDAPASTTPASAPAEAAAPAPPKESTAAPSANGYFVQVAAVSKQEDADALVDALKKKSYSAFATSGAADKLFHVQVGPFEDIKDAEATRGKLVNDGYNPILKK